MGRRDLEVADIFRADGPTATLTFSDWADASDPGGETGQEIGFNFVELQPYLE